MKLIFILSVLSCILFGSDKYRTFLRNDGEKLRLLGNNHVIIKKELNNILSDFKDKDGLERFWIEKYYERVTYKIGRNKRAIDNAIAMDSREINRMSLLEKKEYMRQVEAMGSITDTKIIEKEKNRVIGFDKVIFEKEASWNDAISFFGYSTLSQKDITRDNLLELKISIVLEKIEFLNSSTCLAHIKINGTSDAYKFHKVPKPNYKYKGTYKVNSDIGFSELYSGYLTVHYDFPDKKYFPKPKSEKLNKLVKIDNIVETNSIKSFINIKEYQNSINFLLNDLVDQDEFYDVLLQNDVEYSNIQKIYKTITSNYLFSYPYRLVHFNDIPGTGYVEFGNGGVMDDPLVYFSYTINPNRNNDRIIFGNIDNIKPLGKLSQTKITERFWTLPPDGDIIDRISRTTGKDYIINEIDYTDNSFKDDLKNLSFKRLKQKADRGLPVVKKNEVDSEYFKSLKSCAIPVVIILGVLSLLVDTDVDEPVKSGGVNGNS